MFTSRNTNLTLLLVSQIRTAGIGGGGNPYDGIGNHISGLSEELSKLRQFKNYTQRSGGAMAEAMGDISQRVL
jgi:hypothetical protein